MYTHWDASYAIYNGGSYNLTHADYDYTDVPSYVDSNGSSHSLLDAIDLRRDSDLYYNCSFTAVGKVVPKRKDSLVLKSDGKLSVIKGAGYTKFSSDNYVENGIKLYDLNIEPYEGISYTRTHGVRNTNFIHNLGERISTLEEQILFSPLEASALSSDVGNKTIEGVLVDGFRGADKTDSEKISIDYINNELRPDYTTVYANLNYEDRVITLPLDTTTPKVSDIANLQSDSTILINDITYGKDIGHITIKPITWKDITKPLSIMSDPDNYFSNINHTSVWNDWQNFWYGTINESIYSSAIDVDNKGIKLLGNNYKPQVSGHLDIEVLASADSLSEAWNVTIDGEEIVSYNIGDDLRYNLESSLLSGKREVKISNNKFSATNYLYARGYGHIGQEFSLDGLVQEFRVVADTFYTEVDLYFDTVDDTKPVFVQIRDISTGEAVPYSTVMKEFSDLSQTGKHTFTFSEKILLKPGKYALVVSTTSISMKLVTAKYTGSSIGSLNGNRFSSLKFNLYRANFSTSPSTLSLTTDSISHPIDKIFVNKNYTNKLKIYQSNHGFSVDNYVDLSGFSGRLVQEVVIDADSAASIDDADTPYIGYTVFQQLINVSANDVTDVPNVQAFQSSLDSSEYEYNYGTVMNWNSITKTLTIELISGTLNLETTSGEELMITVVTPSTGGGFGGSHLNPLSISPTTNEIESGTAEGVQTSVAGISSLFLNNEKFKVISKERDSFVVEMESTESFTPTLNGFYGDDTSTVLNGKYRADLVYLNSAKYTPIGTTEKWELKQSSAIQAQLTPNSNTYFPTSKTIEDPSVDWSITTENSRISPVLYRDATDLLMISNDIDNNTFDFTGLDINWVEVATTKVGIKNSILGNEAGTSSESMWLSAIADIEIGDYLILKSGETNATIFVTDTHSEVISVGDTDQNSSGHSVAGTSSIGFDSNNKLYRLVGYIPETHPTDGTALSKYVSNKVSFYNSINGVKVEFDGICPSGNWFEVYADLGNNEFIQLTRLYPDSGISVSYTSFCYQKNIEYTSELKVKIVMKGTNTIDIPKIKNLKILGLSDENVTIPSTYVVEPSTSYVEGAGGNFYVTPDIVSASIANGALESPISLLVTSGTQSYISSINNGTVASYSVVVDSSGNVTASISGTDLLLTDANSSVTTERSAVVTVTFTDTNGMEDSVIVNVTISSQ